MRTSRGSSLPEASSGSPRDAGTLAAAAIVLEIATDAGGERDLDAILRTVLDRLGGVISFTGGSIALLEGDDLVVRAAIGPLEHEAAGQRLRRGPSASWRVVEERRPLRFGDVVAAGLRTATEAGPDGIRSWLAAPIVRHDRAIGLLEVDSPRVDAFDGEDERLLAMVAQALAGPIDLAARYADERRTRQLRDAFAGIVSHELRTPITTIYGMSHVLRRRLGSMERDELAQGIADIEDEADRLRRLTEDLLVLTRAEGGRLVVAREPLVLAHLVRRSVDGEQGRWSAHRIAVDLPADLPLVLGDALSVEQVIRNLLSNAGKYSPGGSTIEVRATRDDGYAVVRVLDEGPGIPDDIDPERLFELFYRSPAATRASAGAGIGLFVCRQLVQAMGGWIRAERRPSGGAAFVVALPAVDPAAAEDES